MEENLSENVVYIINSDGEIINSYNSEDLVYLKATTKDQLNALNRKELEDKQSSRLYFKTFKDCMCDIYKLKGCARNVYDYIAETICTQQGKEEEKLVVSSNMHVYKQIQKRCTDEKGTYSISAIKAAFGELERKKFIFKYKDDDGFSVKGLYIANPRYIYCGTPRDYVDSLFMFSKKGILIMFDDKGVNLESK